MGVKDLLGSDTIKALSMVGEKEINDPKGFILHETGMACSAASKRILIQISDCEFWMRSVQFSLESSIC